MGPCQSAGHGSADSMSPNLSQPSAVSAYRCMRACADSKRGSEQSRVALYSGRSSQLRVTWIHSQRPRNSVRSAVAHVPCLRAGCTKRSQPAEGQDSSSHTLKSPLWIAVALFRGAKYTLPAESHTGACGFCSYMAVAGAMGGSNRRASSF